MTFRPPIPHHRPILGRCLCGQIVFQIKSPSPFGINSCYCTDCQKASGTSHFLSVFVRRQDLSIQARKDGLPIKIDKYQKTADSGRKIDICRCGECGTRLWHEPLAVPWICFVAGGLLDDNSWVIPTSAIYTEKANSGVIFPKDALIFKGPVPDRQILVDKFTDTYGLPRYVLSAVTNTESSTTTTTKNKL
jgi:hypothetical protein